MCLFIDHDFICLFWPELQLMVSHYQGTEGWGIAHRPFSARFRDFVTLLRNRDWSWWLNRHSERARSNMAATRGANMPMTATHILACVLLSISSAPVLASTKRPHVCPPCSLPTDTEQFAFAQILLVLADDYGALASTPHCPC